MKIDGTFIDCKVKCSCEPDCSGFYFSQELQQCHLSLENSLDYYKRQTCPQGDADCQTSTGEEPFQRKSTNVEILCYGVKVKVSKICHESDAYSLRLQAIYSIKIATYFDWNPV